MSKFTTKGIMFVMLIGSGAGQIFASSTITKIENFIEEIPSELRNLESDVKSIFVTIRKDAPIIDADGTEVINVATIAAEVSGNTKAVGVLDVAQNILNGATNAVEAKNVSSAISTGEQIILNVDPKENGAISQINSAIATVTPVVDVVAPLIQQAVDNTATPPAASVSSGSAAATIANASVSTTTATAA